MNSRDVLRDFENIKYVGHRQFVDEMIYEYQIRKRSEERELFLRRSFAD